MLTPSKIFFAINIGVILFIFVRGIDDRAFSLTFKNTDAAYYNGQNLDFKGQVCEEADVDYKSRRLTVCAGSRALITTNLYPEYDYGDFLQISGLVKTPEEFNGFDYERYLARHKWLFVGFHNKI